MTTEKFSKEQFESALPENAVYAGLESGEHVYKINSGKVSIVIRSSVDASGFAADSGKDSIRMWLVNAETNKPLGKKVDAYTTRVTGWEKRMMGKIEILSERAMGIKPCPKCETGLMVERKGKYGAFFSCSNYPNCKNTMKAQPKPLQQKPQLTQQTFSEVEDLLNEVIEAETPKTINFTPSQYQQAIFDFVEFGTGNAVVEAVSGSGKTSTILKALEYTQKDLMVAFVAFSKKIADELKSRAPRHVQVSTLHSLGFANIRKAFGKVKVDNRKVYWIVKDELKNKENTQFGEAVLANVASVIRLVSLCKANLMQPDNANLEYLSTNYDINVNGDAHHIYRMAKIAFEKSIAQTWRIDFDDMIYFCATKVECQRFDWLFIDECQDLNKAQIKMVLNSIHDKSRVVAVGDSKQSIFGFRGADTQSIENLTKALNAETLPLSITYRCPKLHVKLAQELVPTITAWENAKEGKISDISKRHLVSTVKPGDFVLCRTNAPLVGPAFELIRNGIKAIILGRDIGQGLINLIDKVVKTKKCKTLGELLFNLDEYLYSEFSKLIAQGKENKAQSIDDKVKTINALADGSKTIPELKQRIENVFTDNAEGVIFSSVHKAKGLEADRVFILQPELMPHPLAMKSKNPEALQQELNIRYVALTRSKSELYFVV